MPKLSAIKEFFDWVAYGKLIVDIAIAFFGVSTVRAALVTFTKIPEVWLIPVEWLSGALFLWLLLRYGFAWRSWGEEQRGNRGQSLAATALASTNVELDAKKILAAAYNSTLEEEIERNIDHMIADIPKNERDTIIVKYIASQTLFYVYDGVWWTIFKSQLKALEELNRRVRRIEDVRTLYADAVEQYPDFYSSYSFEQWLGYLKNNTLILDCPGDAIGITQRGTDFLKYLIHCGRSANDRRL